jgi:hypothetical protein
MTQTIATKTGWDLETVWILLQYLSVRWVPDVPDVSDVPNVEKFIQNIPNYEKLQIHYTQSLTQSSDVEVYYKTEIEKLQSKNADKIFKQLSRLLTSTRFSIDYSETSRIKDPEQTRTWIQSLQHLSVLKKIQTELSIDLNSKQWHNLSSYDKLLIIDYLSS